jgi:hypothetical protein
MPPKKKKGKGKKKKEVVPITDPEMLRVIGVPLDGTEINLRVYYHELGHPISIALKLTDLATVGDMVSQFHTITNASPGTNFIFVGKLRKSPLSTIMVQYDGKLNLKDDLGIENKDELTFIEADERMTQIYTKKRMNKLLDVALNKRSTQTAELVLAKRDPNPSEALIAEMEENINITTKEINEYRSYVNDPKLGYEKLGKYTLVESKEGDEFANVPRTFKKFGALPVEEQQRLKNLVSEGLSIKRANEELLEAQRLKAMGGGKKGKNGKKKKKK